MLPVMKSFSFSSQSHRKSELY